MPRKNESKPRALFIVKPPAPVVDQAEIEEIKKQFREMEISDFAQDLEVARLMFRKYPHFVASDVFPEPYRSKFIEENGYDPDETDESTLRLHDNHISDPEQHEKHVLKQAERVAVGWAEDRLKAELRQSHLRALPAVSNLVQ